MAQLKDTIVSGNLRVTDTTLTDTLHVTIIKAPTSSGGSTYGPGTSGQVLKSNGTTTYWASDSNTDKKVKVTANTTTKGYLIASTTSPNGTAVEGIADTGVYLGTTAGSLYATSFYENGTSLASKYAPIGHKHTTTIAADSGTNQLTLAASTKYKLTAGETNFIFTTPPNTTYSANNGVGLSGTTFYNSGVRAVSTGSAKGTISVNTNGSTDDVAVKGLGTAAYNASSDFAVSQTLANDTNLNNITTPGFYNCGGTNSVTNKPSNVDAFGLNVIHDAIGQWYTQILYPNNASPLIYVRNYNSSAWSGWNSIAIGSFLPLSGGTMTGTIRGTYSNTHIALAGGGIGDYATLDHKNNINISSWNGVSISNGCSSVGTLDQVTFSVNARTGATQQRGDATIGGNITITSSGSLIQKQNSGSNWTPAIKWWSGGTDPGNYGPCIAQHNTGGDDSTYPGSITILPYHTTDQPWYGTVGLFIKKDHVYIDGVELSKSTHTHNYAGSLSAGGAANSANVLNKNTRMDYGWDGVNYFNINGTAGNAAKVNDTPTTAWWHIMRFNHTNSAGYYTDLAIPLNTTSLYYKRITAGSVQNGGWVKVLDSLNYTSYALPRNIKHIHTASGTEGTTGWVKIARITVTAAYADHPMTFTIAQRQTMQYRIHLVFGNTGSVATTTISQFIIARDNSWTDTNNNPRAYIIKPSDGIFDLYIRKIEGYDHIFVVDFTKADNSEGNNYSVAWTNVHAADSEITGGTEAVKKLYLSTSGGTVNGAITVSDTGTFRTNAFGTQLIVERTTAESMASVTFKNPSGILGHISANTVDGDLYHYGADTSKKYIILDTGNCSNYTFKVTRGSSVSTATTGYWAAMCNSTQTGSPVLPTSGKWWHVISMDWSGNDIKNWVSQLAIATQDGSGVWWRRNDTGGTTINSYSWHRLAEGNSSGAATHVATEVGDTAGARPVFYAYLGDNTRVVYNTNFTYNPSGNVLTATTFAGNTFKAGKANTTDGEIKFYRSGGSGETTLKATAQSTSGTYLLPACGNGSYTLSIGMSQVGGVGNSLVISNVSGIPTGTLSFKIIFKSDAASPIYSMIEIPNVGDDIDCGGIIQVGDYTDGQQGSLRIVMKGVVVRVTAGTTAGTKTFTATVSPTQKISGSSVSEFTRNVIMWKIYACC